MDHEEHCWKSKSHQHEGIYDLKIFLPPEREIFDLTGCKNPRRVEITVSTRQSVLNLVCPATYPGKTSLGNLQARLDRVHAVNMVHHHKVKPAMMTQRMDISSKS